MFIFLSILDNNLCTGMIFFTHNRNISAQIQTHHAGQVSVKSCTHLFVQ